MRWWLGGALTAVAATVGVGSLLAEDGLSRPGLWAGDAVAGLCLGVCGLAVAVSGRHPALGWLLMASAWAWFLPDAVARLSLVPATVMGALLLLHRGVMAHSFFAYPTGRLRTAPMYAVVAAAYVVQVATGVWSVTTNVLLGATAMVGLTAFVATRPGPGARTRDVGVVAGVLLWTVIAALALLRSVGGLGGGSNGLLTTYQLTVSTCAIALAIGSRIGAPRRADVTNLVVELGSSRSGGLSGLLAEALDDPLLEVAYRVPATGQYVDDHGRPVDDIDPGPGRASTVLRGPDGEPVAVLLHDRKLVLDPDLGTALATASALFERNAQLQAELANQLAEMQQSRRRLVTTADAERDLLESRLRAGPGATLAEVGSAIESAHRSATSPSTREHAARAASQLQSTVAELTDLAGGLSASHRLITGLGPAIEELARTCERPVSLSIDRVDAPQEVLSCCYFVCSEALVNVAKHAPAAAVHIAVRQVDGNVALTVSDDGPGGASVDGLGAGLTGLADRVEALGGSFSVESSPGGGTRVSAVISSDSPAAGRGSEPDRRSARAPV
jgi:signal transduction histidine kinase